MTGEEGVKKERGDREMFCSVSYENIGNNILLKVKNIFRPLVCLTVIPSICMEQLGSNFIDFHEI